MYHPLIAQASNIKTQENPVYTKKDFLEFIRSLLINCRMLCWKAFCS